MKLKKRPGTEMRIIETVAQVETNKIQPMATPATEEVECEVWEDIDGNAYAWTPVGSGVISIEVNEGDEDIIKTYKALKQKKTSAPPSPEERIAQLEEALAKALKKLADLEAK